MCCYIATTSKKDAKDTTSHHPYMCSCCGVEYEFQKGNFYYTRSPLYKGNGNYATICINCITKKFKEVETQTGSSRYALIVFCHMLDCYYAEKIFNNMASDNTFTLGSYLNSFNGRQWANKTFATNLLHNDFADEIESDDSNIPVVESIEDIKNKNYCLSQIGYDPFVDNVPCDRIFLFNVLCEYLTDDVVEDPHRVQSVIPLVKSILQESKMDKLIDFEQKAKAPNTDLIKTYVESKDKLRKLINATANENGFTVKSTGKTARGTNTLTGIMKEMAENNYEDIKVNLFDVKMNGTYKNIADISNKSLFDQLNPQSDDYARMVATQREIIQKFEEDKLKYEETIRLLKRENKKLKELDGGKK